MSERTPKPPERAFTDGLIRRARDLADRRGSLSYEVDADAAFHGDMDAELLRALADRLAELAAQSLELLDYAEHEPACPAKYQTRAQARGSRCTCGLAALAEAVRA